jgi:hypothetical protein
MPDNRWVQRESYHLVSLRGKKVKIVLRGDVVLRGKLTGADTYDLFIQPAGGPEIMVHEGAIKYMHQIEDDKETE